MTISFAETAHVSVHTWCTLCPLNEYSTCFTTFNLCGDSFLQSRRAGPLSLTTGLVARIWWAHHCDPASISDWEPKPCSKPLQADPVTFFPQPASPPGIKTNGLWESSEASFCVFCVSWNNFFFFSPPYHKRNSYETPKFEALEPTKSIPLYVSVLAM